MYKITDLTSGYSITLDSYDDCLDQMTAWQELEHDNKCDEYCPMDECCPAHTLNHYRIEEITNN